MLTAFTLLHIRPTSGQRGQCYFDFSQVATSSDVLPRLMAALLSDDHELESELGP